MHPGQLAPSQKDTMVVPATAQPFVPLAQGPVERELLARLALEAHKRTKAEAELEIAREIQQQLFPRRGPDLPGFDIAGKSYPAQQVGADYFDFFVLPDGCLAIALGDVAGHGVGPALLMAETRAYLRAFARTYSDPGEILRLVNHMLLEDMLDGLFMTLLLARLDNVRGTLQYSNAGHPEACLCRGAGEVTTVLPPTGPPLGVVPSDDFTDGAELALLPGDMLVLFTDGFLEARRADGALFGLQRVQEAIASNRGLRASQQVDKLYRAACAFAQPAAPVDDMTVVVIRAEASLPADGRGPCDGVPACSGLEQTACDATD